MNNQLPSDVLRSYFAFRLFSRNAKNTENWLLKRSIIMLYFSGNNYPTVTRNVCGNVGKSISLRMYHFVIISHDIAVETFGCLT